MNRRNYFLLALELLWLLQSSWTQRSPFSLQAAVDELHHREAAKYPLNSPPSQQHYYGGGGGGGLDGGVDDYWDDDTAQFPAITNKKYRNHQRLNKALVKYLERENYDADHGGLSLGPFGGYEFDEDSNVLYPGYINEKKRSSSYFRERDSKYDPAPTSVFRERESQSPLTNGGGVGGVGVVGGVGGVGDHAELTEQFLREIEQAQEHEREERYKDALRHLWEKYQQQENEIKGDLFEEKKRMRVPPYFMLMEKKRSYPVLPWLPYGDRKKRFPVAKRSTKRSFNENAKSFGKTDEKVARELDELFGSTNEEKKKRSTDALNPTTRSPVSPLPSTEMSDMRLELPSKPIGNASSTDTTIKDNGAVDPGEHHQHGHAGNHGHNEKEHKHRKRSEHHESPSHEEHEEEEESQEHDPEEHEEETEDENDPEGEAEEESEEDYEEERKRKRDTGVQLSSRRKKSIDWSKYFGIDRKKKRSTTTDLAPVDEKDKKKRELDPEKLDNMDRKIQSIEDFIIDETIKYTGAHEGIVNPEEIRRLKDHVLSRLATAYNLEKMRRALDKIRQSVDNQNHLLRNIIEPDAQSDENESLESQKRLSIKKENALLHDNNAHSSSAIDKTTNPKPLSKSRPADYDSLDQDDSEITKKKKKRNGYLRFPDVSNDFNDFDDDLGVGRYESLNDAYLGNKNYIIGSNQCPQIEAMAERCRGVDLLSGDINQELLPICGVHQLCYLCSTSRASCDYNYLDEADGICSNNNECLSAARSVLIILRGTPGPQLGPRECLKHTCLYNAMRETGL